MTRRRAAIGLALAAAILAGTGVARADIGALVRVDRTGVPLQAPSGAPTAPPGGVAYDGPRAARPNPFDEGTALEFELAEGGDVDLAVYDVSGARVRTLPHRAMSPGRHGESWNGEDDRGRPVHAGIYLVRFSAPHTRQVRKLVRVR